MDKHRITVVGGCNIDIGATAYAALQNGDSNPGRVRVSFGGVGRNIAENLVRLGQSVRMISALGDDAFAPLLKAQAKSVGMDLSESLLLKDARSSVYVCINAPDGEMMVAISDMDGCDLLTPAFLETKLELLNASEAVVLDANLPEASIRFLAQRCTAPLFADSVSAKKVAKLKGVLGALRGIKTNRIEAELLTQRQILSVQDAQRCCDDLRAAGVALALITLGPGGAVGALHDERLLLPPMTGKTVNTTGCGDAFFAGAVVAYLEKSNLREILRCGLGMAALCAAAPDTVSPDINATKLASMLEAHQGGQWQ
ncbi:MAG: carbohydrate kinase family protein [Clostridia bacterium]